MTAQPDFGDMNVSRETLDHLSHYVSLLQKWNQAINLVSKSTIPQIWQRHIADSLQLASYLDGSQPRWADLGSGGGLPALVVAIVAKEHCPDVHFDLVEVDQRKSVFLQQVARDLDLRVKVHTTKIEDTPPLDAHVLSARALASLPILCSYAQRHLNADGFCLFPKGAQWEVEVAEARKLWSFSLEQATSKTEPQAKLLILRAIEHV